MSQELILPMAPLFHCFSVKFSIPPIPKKFVAVCIKSKKLCYVLLQTYINVINLHFLIMDTYAELPAKRCFTVNICTMLRSIHTTTKCPRLVYNVLSEILIYCFDLQKKSCNLVLFLICACFICISDKTNNAMR